MPLDTLLALTGILLASVWTPGPNNAMLSASGATFGFRATIPHMMGVAFGFPLMLFIVALGLGEVFARTASVQEILRWVGAAVMGWVAWRIATAGPPGSRTARKRPFRLIEAVGFQWINPKAWAMALGVTSQFVTGSAVLTEATICTIVAILCGLTSATGWVSFGVWMQRWLHAPMRFRLFNGAMAGIIVLGVALLLLADL